jgi:superfamily II DNA or RNA helicase
MKPRSYQIDCHNAIMAARNEGVTRQLCVLPTGTGKMTISAMVPDVLGVPRNMRSLFLVHRDELAYQAADKLQAANPGRTVGIEKAQFRAENADIVVASVQTIGSSKVVETDEDSYWEFSPRIQQFNRDQFALIQADEAHHLTVHNKQWSSVLRYFQVLKGAEDENFKRMLCAWTATPSRADGLGLEAFFDKIVYHYDLLDAIKDGWLVRVVGHPVETEVDISKVRTTAGDFNAGDLAASVNTPERNEIAINTYEEICPGVQALFFTANIQHSHDFADAMTRRGWKVHALSGNTPEGDRRKLMQLIREGQIHGLASAAVIDEGTDVPIAEAAFMLAPTKSGLRYRQRVGRVLRPFPSPEDLADMRARGVTPKHIKTSAKVVDLVDVCGKHALVTLPTLFGLRANFKAKGKDLIEVVEEIEQLEMEHAGVSLRGEPNMEAIRTAIRTIDLMRAPIIPPEVQKYSRLTWLADGPGCYRIGRMDGSMLSVRETALGSFEIYSHVKGVRTFVGCERTLQESIINAEKEIPGEDKIVMKADAGWRTHAPTEKQTDMLYMVNKKLQASFRDKKTFFTYCLQQHKMGSVNHSRGAISTQIDLHRKARRF